MLKLHVFRFSDVVHCVLVACGVEKRKLKGDITLACMCVLGGQHCPYVILCLSNYQVCFIISSCLFLFPARTEVTQHVIVIFTLVHCIPML